ncbi:NlpC/P60 family protein [Citreimonas sp.]|uniref:NlpC/P60 family protein n=1 Tax=Citreimonas sp. TaxID=3036715 RepID=UPI0040592D6E
MSAVVEAARGWIGTPYVHQASAKGAGTDCLGLLRGVWRELLGAEPAAVPAYSRDWGETGGDELLLAAGRTHLRQRPLGLPLSGDVLLFRMRDRAIAKHVGIQARIGSEASFIHAYTGHGVIESPLSNAWARRVVARFAFPMENE